MKDELAAIKVMMNCILVEMGVEYIEIAKDAESHIVEYVKNYAKDEDNNKSAAKKMGTLMGLLIAQQEIEQD